MTRKDRFGSEMPQTASATGRQKTHEHMGRIARKAVIAARRDIGARDPEPTSAELWVRSSA
jgi:hypothetical protein